MSYTQLAVLAVAVAVLLDVAVLRTTLLRRKAFWVSYLILGGFQLVTNGVLAGLPVVRYSGATMIGDTTPADSPPPFLGAGRVAYAPVEDLLFGFALVLATLALWVWWGRRGVQRTPYAGPPRWGVRAARPPGDPGAHGRPGAARTGGVV